ncbi:asialoglycoprotein receptor 2-like [Asterias amurensis]|uniref:asialoglycoprotein receptor 2-like n=1 Tax=Asterias amurensis TaxID=7602 RepID=UPI003AB5B941
MAYRVIEKICYNLVSLSVISMVIKGVFAARGCPYRWVPYGDSCYLGLDGSMEGHWSAAVTQCNLHNAYIMVPSSDWETRFILNSFQLHDDLIGVWINCNDEQVEGDWNCYENGNPTEYRKWDYDQPDDDTRSSDQDYAMMITKGNTDSLGRWRDLHNEFSQYIVCERPRQARCG